MDDPLVIDYLQARAERDKAQAHLDEVQASLVKQMEQNQRKSYHWVEDGAVRLITYKVNRTSIIDEKGLRKAMTAKVFDRYTKRVLDRKAMEAALDSGEVNKTTVSKFVTIKVSKPYVALTEKEIES